MEKEKLRVYEKCRNCRFYDATPFPEYGGKLAKCVNPNKDDIGDGKIGFFTLASSKCFERRAEDGKR